MTTKTAIGKTLDGSATKAPTAAAAAKQQPKRRGKVVSTSHRSPPKSKKTTTRTINLQSKSPLKAKRSSSSLQPPPTPKPGMYPPIYRLQIDTDEIFRSPTSTPKDIIFDKLQQRYGCENGLSDEQKSAVMDRIQYLVERQTAEGVDVFDFAAAGRNNVTPLDTPWPDERILQETDYLFHTIPNRDGVSAGEFCTTLHETHHFFMPPSTKRMIKQRLKNLALGTITVELNVSNKYDHDTDGAAASSKDNEKERPEIVLDALCESSVTETMDKNEDKKRMSLAKESSVDHSQKPKQKNREKEVKSMKDDGNTSKNEKETIVQGEKKIDNDDDGGDGDGPMLTGSAVTKKRKASVSKVGDQINKIDEPAKKRSKKETLSSTKAAAVTRTKAVSLLSSSEAATTTATSSSSSHLEGNDKQQRFVEIIERLQTDLENDRKARTERLHKAKMYVQAAKLSYDNCLAVMEEMKKDDEEHFQRVEATIKALLMAEKEK